MWMCHGFVSGFEEVSVVPVGDAVMAAIVLRLGKRLAAAQFEQFLAEQRDLSPTTPPRYARFDTE